MRIDQWLHQARLQLNTDSARLDAELLLAHILRVSRTYLYTWSDKELSVEDCQAVTRLLEQRKQGQPIAYLLGMREFWSLPLAVSSATLIPRPDTETLVEWALELPLPTAARVLDLGTGTGAIALALASERPQWNIVAIDAQYDAVDLALRNSEQLQLPIQVKHSDWFSAINEPFDLIVSNPPYIDPLDPHLLQGDVRFEPHSALIADDHGLADLYYIIEQAPNYLTNGGWLLLEHGYRQADKVVERLTSAHFEHCVSRNDLAKQPRVSGGCWFDSI